MTVEFRYALDREIEGSGENFFASKAQGILASTALQPGQAATLSQGVKADSALQPGQAATLAQGAKADSALQPGAAATPAQGVKADTALQPGSSVPFVSGSLKSNSPLNISRDKALYSSVVSLVRLTGDATFNLLYGPQQAIQSWCYDEVNGYWYTIHDNNQTPNNVIMCRYPKAGAGSITATQDQVANPNTILGHQGLAVENLASGAAKFWCTDGTDKTSVIRFDFVNAADPANVQKFDLFSAAQGFNTGVSCFDGLSYDQRFIVGHGLLVGQQKVMCRVWDKAAMLSSGAQDQTNTFLTEFDLGALYVPSSYPVQGIAFDGETIVGVSGGNGFVVGPRKIYKYAFPSGEILEPDENVMVGSVEAAADGSGISYEPEGAHVIKVDGQPRYAIGIRSGSSLTPSVFRVHALGAAGASDINIPASGPAQIVRRLGVPIGGVEINTTAYKLLSYGTGVNIRFGTLGTENWEVESTAGGFRPAATDTYSIGQSSRRPLAVWAKSFTYSTAVFDSSGTGSPLNVVVANIGSTYRRTDGGASTTFYVKEAGNGLSTGWVAK